MSRTRPDILCCHMTNQNIRWILKKEIEAPAADTYKPNLI